MHAFLLVEIKSEGIVYSRMTSMYSPLPTSIARLLLSLLRMIPKDILDIDIDRLLAYLFRH